MPIRPSYPYGIDARRGDCLRNLNCTMRAEAERAVQSRPDEVILRQERGETLSDPFKCLVLSMDEEDASADRLPGPHPVGKLAAIGMAAIDVQLPDAGSDTDIVALNTYDGGSFFKKASQGTVRLVANQKHCRLVSPEPVFQAMPNAPGLTHSARSDDNMETPDEIDRLGLLRRFGKANILRLDPPNESIAVLELAGMPAENLARTSRKR